MEKFAPLNLNREELRLFQYFNSPIELDVLF